MPTLRESAQRAAIVGGADRDGVRSVRKEFRSFRAAAHYYLLKLPIEQRDACCIATADGKRWRRSDLLQLFKYDL